MPRRIIRNAAQCLRCGDVVESLDRQQLTECRCGAVAVDGGYEYLRRLGRREDRLELSVWAEASNEDIGPGIGGAS